MTEQTPDNTPLDRILDDTRGGLTPVVRDILTQTCTEPNLTKTVILGGGIGWGKTTIAKRIALHRALTAMRSPESFPGVESGVPLVIEVLTPVAAPIADDLRRELATLAITPDLVRVVAYTRFDEWENRHRGARFDTTLGVICEAPYWFGRTRAILDADASGEGAALRFRVGCFNREVIAVADGSTPTFAVNLPLWGAKPSGLLSGRIAAYAVIRDGRATLVSINEAVFIGRDPSGGRLLAIPTEHYDLFEKDLATALLDCYGIETVR